MGILAQLPCECCGAMVSDYATICYKCGGNPKQFTINLNRAGSEQLEKRFLAKLAESNARFAENQKRIDESLEKMKREGKIKAKQERKLKAENKLINKNDNVYSKLVKSGWKYTAMDLLVSIYDCYYGQAQDYIYNDIYQFEQGNYNFEDFSYYYMASYKDGLDKSHQSQEKKIKNSLIKEKEKPLPAELQKEIDNTLKQKAKFLKEMLIKAENAEKEAIDLFNQAKQEEANQRKKWFSKNFEKAFDLYGDAIKKYEDVYRYSRKYKKDEIEKIASVRSYLRETYNIKFPYERNVSA